MIGGLLKSASRLALVAAAGVIAHSAQAADLGGNCCADLEERVAELEATTARKGNRKVSLTIYGQISQQVTYWNDGGEKNVYVGESDDDKNLIGFRGTAKINSDWSAGFKLEYEAKGANTADANQLVNGDNSGIGSSPHNTRSLSLRHAYWTLGSATYGTMSVGWQSVAAGGVASINLADPAGHATNDSGAWSNSFLLRGVGTAPGNAGLSTFTWNSIDPRFGSGANGSSLTRRNSVKYSSPLFLGLSKSSGFRVETSWGEDDYWDAALKYVEDFGTFRVAAGVAYTQMNDTDSSGCANVGSATGSTRDCHIMTIGGSIMHTPTGLYLTGSYAKLTDENRLASYQVAGGNQAAMAAAGLVDNEESWWYVQAGWEAKLNSLGKTTFWGDYFEGTVGSSPTGSTLAGGDVLNSFATNGAILQSSNVTAWGLGVTQNIDAAAMKLFLGYKVISGEATLYNGVTTRQSNAIEDLQVIYSGATIKF